MKNKNELLGNSRRIKGQGYKDTQAHHLYDHMDEIKRMIDQHYTYTQIRDKMKVSDSSMDHFMQDNHLSTKTTVWLSNHFDMLVQDLRLTHDEIKTAKMLGVSARSLSYYIHECGLNMYDINHKFNPNYKVVQHKDNPADKREIKRLKRENYVLNTKNKNLRAKYENLKYHRSHHSSYFASLKKMLGIS